MKTTRKPAPRKRPQTRKIDKKPAFLAAFRASSCITHAAQAVKINRRQHYDWIAEDPQYAKDFDQAVREAARSLLVTAVERSVVGDFVPNVYQGRFCYPQEEYVIREATPAVAAVAALDWKEEGGPRDAVPAVEAVTELRALRDVPGAAPLGMYRKSEMLNAILLRAWVPEFKAAVELTGAGGGAIQVSLAEVLRERRAKREGAPQPGASTPPKEK